jgi:hypothetical protein
MLGVGAVPPATTFTDTSVTPGTVYIYFVLATADAPNAGSSSAPSLPSAQVTPPATASASFAPLSVSTGFAEGNSGDAIGGLQAGDTFTVGFNSAVSVSPTFNLNVSDGVDTAVLNNTNSTLTLSSPTSVIYTVTNTSIPGTPGTLAFVPGTNPLEVTGQSGVSNSVGQWNVAGSLASNGPYIAVFGATNNNLVTSFAPGQATPAIGQITAPTGTTTVPITSCANGATVTLYTENGTALGSNVCAATISSIVASSTVLPSTVLIASETLGGIGYVSESAVSVGFSPLPIASTGSLTTPLTVVNVTLTSLPLLSVHLGFVAGGEATPGSALVGATSVGALTAAAFTVSSTGQIVVNYTVGNDTAPPHTDTLTESNGTTTAATTTFGTDTYIY